MTDTTSSQLLDTKGFSIELLREGGLRLQVPRHTTALWVSAILGVVFLAVGLVPLFVPMGRGAQIAFLAIFTLGFALILSAFRMRLPEFWFVDPVGRRLERRRGKTVQASILFDEIESVSAHDLPAASGTNERAAARAVHLKTRYTANVLLAVLSPADAEKALRALEESGLPVVRG